MKFLSFAVIDPENMVAVSQATDKAMASPPPGYKVLARYVCMSNPAAGLPTSGLVSITIAEADSAESMMAVRYPVMVAGAYHNAVPVMEVPTAGLAEEEKKYRR